jgi:hypothetical protein
MRALTLALPILMASSFAFAQSPPKADLQPPGMKLTKAQITQARKDCFAEAKVRAPGPMDGGGSAGNQSMRENAYRDCAARKGVRP